MAIAAESDRAAFLFAIAQRPDDNLPKLIFADWLGERGFAQEEAYWRGNQAIPEELDGDYTDWRNVFAYAGEQQTDGYSCDGSANLALANPTTESPVPITPFGRQDVKRIIALTEGENDGPDWVCVGELFDGRFFAVAAGCDYTGWG